MTPNRDCFVLVYVDDLLFLGAEQTTDRLFTAIQQQLLLRPTGTLTPGNTVSFLGRNITNCGDHYEISLNDEYTTTLLTEMNLHNSNPAPAPGTSALKAATADQEQQLSKEEHAQFRRAVGKLQWLTYTRPDISYATKELARSLQQTVTGQDVQQPGSQHLDSSLRFSEQQSTMEAEHRQQSHCQVRRQSFTPSTPAQQKHYTSETF